MKETAKITRLEKEIKELKSQLSKYKDLCSLTEELLEEASGSGDVIYLLTPKERADVAYLYIPGICEPIVTISSGWIGITTNDVNSLEFTDFEPTVKAINVDKLIEVFPTIAKEIN